MHSESAAPKAPILVLYGNRPQPLVFEMVALIEEVSWRPVELLYLDDRSSKVGIPLAARFEAVTTVPIRGKRGGTAIGRIINGVLCIARFVKRIRQSRPCVVHAWNFDMLLAAFLARMSGRKFRIIYTMQDTRKWMIADPIKPLERWVYRAVSLIFVTSRGFEDHLLRRFRLIPPEKRVVYTPNVPRSKDFPPVTPRRHGDGLTVGYFGFIRGQSALETLIAAAEKVQREGEDVRLLFAGIGTERDFVKRMAEEKDFVRFLGPYKHEDIVKLYEQVDAVYAIYDQSYDKRIHLAYRICESINCGLPIIVAENTHMAEVVDEYGVGISVPFGDSDRLAAALLQLSRDPARRREIEQNCEKARADFAFEHCEDTIRQAYAKVLAE